MNVKWQEVALQAGHHKQPSTAAVLQSYSAAHQRHTAVGNTTFETANISQAVKDDSQGQR